MWRGGSIVLLGCLASLLASCDEAPGEEARLRDDDAGGRAAAGLPADASGKIRLANGRLGGSVTFLVSGASGAGSERDGAMIYPSALGPGFDLLLSATPRGVEDHIRLPRPLPGGRIRYDVTLGPEIAGLRVANGTVELLLASGTPALRAGGASVVDRTGQRIDLDLDVEGCDVDRSAAPPWGRAPVAPGSSRCTFVAELPADLDYPAVYDPLWTQTDAMVLGRFTFGATLMADGRVMAAGGFSNGAQEDVEIYDPATDTWSVAPSLPGHAYGFTLTTLDDGRVLLAGGGWSTPSDVILPSAYVFSPTTMDWTPVPSMSSPRAYHTATLLPDGRVLVTGGETAISGVTSVTSCEIFDPSTNTWSPTDSLVDPRSGHTAANIGGRILVAGGWSSNTYAPVNTSEVFDPAANTGAGAWVSMQTFNEDRADHGMALLGSDKVLIGGGLHGYGFGGVALIANSVELFDVPNETWTTLGDFPVGTATAAARVAGGGVLLGGGCADNYQQGCLNASGSPFYFDPIAMNGFPAGTFPPRGRHQMLSLADGRAMVFGGVGFGPGDFVADTRIFAPQQNGAPCAEAFECASGFCVDDVCCDAACEGLCESCLDVLTGSGDGSCAPVAGGTDPENECTDDGSPSCAQNGFCNGGACETYAGPGCAPQPCADDAACTSGFCVDGVCCDAACDALCEACTAATKGQGFDGECGPIARGLDPELECSPASTLCTERNVCDGEEACTPLQAGCAPYACSSAGCLATCVGDAECQPGFACVASACVPEAGLCTEGTKGLQNDGIVIDCAPFRCNADGTCKTGCASVNDCAPPLVCEPGGGSCIEPPPAEGGEQGCACRAAGTDHGGRGPAWLTLALAALATRRRARA